MNVTFHASVPTCGHVLTPANHVERMCHACIVTGQLSYGRAQSIRDASRTAAQNACRRVRTAPMVRADVVAERLTARRRDRKFGC